MSAIATAWAWEQDVRGGEKLILLAYADQARDDGAMQLTQAEVATKTGISERTIRETLGRLEGVNLAKRHARYEAGQRIADVVKLAVDGSVELPADFAGRRLPAGFAGSDLQGQSSTGEIRQAHLPPTSKEDPGEGGRRTRRDLPVYDDPDAVPSGMMNDALELMRRKAKVDGQLVTGDEMGLAAGVLAEFNRLAGYDYGLGAHLRAIVGRIRERPSYRLAEHVRLTQSAWRLKWWERNGKGRRPTPAVIYGNAAVFEQVIADATDERAGRGAPATPKRFERKGPRIGSPERPI